MQKSLRRAVMCCFLAGSLAASTSTVLAANSQSVKLYVNDLELSMFDKEVKKEMPAVLYNNRTLVPLKKTFEIYGLTVKWNEKAKTIESTAPNGDKIWLQVGNKQAKVGKATVALDVPATVISNRTYVPLAFVGKAIGNAPVWDANTFSVNIYTDGTNELNFSLVPANFGLPMRNYGKISFVADENRSMTIQKTTLNFFDEIAAVAKTRFARSADFMMAYESDKVQIAVYTDTNIGMERHNIVVKNGGAVYGIEVTGISKADAVALVRKILK